GRHCVLGSEQPKLQGPFVALAGFYVVWKFFGLAGGDAPAAVLGAARGHCALPWREVSSTLGHHINVEKYCMWGPYVAHLITAGLGLTPEQYDIGSGDVGWPVGAALAEALRLPGMGPQPPLVARLLPARLLPSSWAAAEQAAALATDEGSLGEWGGSSGLGLGAGLRLLWALLLVLLFAWCCACLVTRAWGRVGLGGGIVRVFGGPLSLPLAGRGRQAQQRRTWLV
ncbi:hypothetical protein Agub_g1845, partial [Astrephomene gubernaculifera]